MPHSNRIPRARSRSAQGPNPNLPTEQRQHSHGASKPPGLLTSRSKDHDLASETPGNASPGHKGRLLDTTGGLPLGHAPEINPSVAPRGRRKSSLGSLQFHTAKGANIASCQNCPYPLPDLPGICFFFSLRGRQLHCSALD